MKGAADILFEIGTEELPAATLADIYQAPENILEEKTKKIFQDRRVPFKNCRVWATPRRLIFWIEGAGASQSPKDNPQRILLKQEAYDAAGKPTEKLLTILKHRVASAEETFIAGQNGREYVFLKKAEPVSKTVSLLPEILTALVKALPFPKNMKWDDSGLVFPRPIRHALCFFGDKAVSFKLGGVRVKNETVIFSKGRRKRHAVKDPASYLVLLKKHGIMPDPAPRRAAIQEALTRLASSSGAKVYEDAFLLNEVNFLTESPQAVSASFAAEFLKLPVEVLAVSMARKQRLFGVVDKNGGLLPRFLAVLDGPVRDKEKKIIAGNMENILRAKLQDSLFFYREDAKTSLEKKREELKNLVFLKDAGSMLEKSDRLLRLAKELRRETGLSEKDQETLERACVLCKSDLLTHMVGEFPELQGVMGKTYALEGGEGREVAEAIGEHYLPRTAGDRLPETPAGCFLSILDKCDLVTACFALGMEPSSSLDPFGLRRSATAVIRTAVDKKLHFSLKDVVRRIVSAHKIDKPKYDGEALVGKLCGEAGFFWDRFRACVVGPSLSGDLVDAVVAARCEDFLEVYERAVALSGIAQSDNFLKACKVVERTSNILKGGKEPAAAGPDPALLAEELERAVFAHYEKSAAPIRREAEAGNFKQATSLYAEAFFDILNEFFDKVFVNAEDPKVRVNRLALLRAVNRLYTAHIADLSKIRVNELL